jgi:hypothetical protein
MTLFLSYVALGAGLFAVATLLSVAYRVYRSDKIEGNKSAARASSLTDLLLGRARTREDWIPDARVKGGIIYNKRKRRIEVSGRLSDDSLDRVFGPR